MRLQLNLDSWVIITIPTCQSHGMYRVGKMLCVLPVDITNDAQVDEH